MYINKRKERQRGAWVIVMTTAKYVIATNSKAYLFDTKKEADNFVFENHKAMVEWIDKHSDDVARDGYKKVLDSIEKTAICDYVTFEILPGAETAECERGFLVNIDGLK